MYEERGVRGLYESDESKLRKAVRLMLKFSEGGEISGEGV